MAVAIKKVLPGSLCWKKGVRKGDQLISINGNPITDVLDYQFYITESKLTLVVRRDESHYLMMKIKKEQYEDIGLEFETYLMTFKYGAPPHGGLGIGLERLTMHRLGFKNVRDAAMFTRESNRVNP